MSKNQNKPWKPKQMEQVHLELIIGMATDCLLGNGTDTRKTFTDNVRRIANCMDELPEKGI